MKKAIWMIAAASLLLSAQGFAQEGGEAAAKKERKVRPCGEVPQGMACIPGGDFLRGSKKGKGRRNSRPQATIWMPTYLMDVYEVTYSDYQKCVKRGNCDPRRPAYADYNRAKQPMVGLSWYEAVKYCKAQGKHLPTEAEWEKAARGTDGRLYPWGDEKATCEKAVIMNARGERSCGVKKKKGKGPKKGRTFVVGTRKPNQYGLYDMAGNSWEWVADWYTRSYKKCGDDCLGDNPKGPCGGKEPCKGYKMKLVRGGSWYWPARYAQTTWRRPHYPSNKPYHHFGFRCAATLDEAPTIIAIQKKRAAARAARDSEKTAKKK